MTNESRMRVLILGVGDAFTRSHFNTSALIQAPQGYVLLDCPALIHRVLRESTGRAGWNVQLDDIQDIIITHLHGDHCGGLEAFGFWRAHERRSDASCAEPRVHTSRASAERMWERLAPAMDRAGTAKPLATLQNYFDMHILEPGATAEVLGLTVQCRFTGHPIPTIGLLISDGQTTLGWSGDTPFEQEHIEWLSQADVIVHESGPAPAHTPIEQLNALPEELRAKIRLVHLPDDFDVSQTELRPLHEGEVLAL